MPPQEAASDAAAQQARVIAAKAGQRERTHIIVVDERGQRQWQIM